MIYSRKITLNPIMTLVIFFSAVTVYLSTWGITRAENAQNSIPTEEIKITGDMLISNRDQNYAEFRGNVEAVQGDFIIKSDTLRIYYNQDINLKKDSAANKEAIKKIIARGNVRIWSGKNYVETENAEYSTQDMLLVLTGENSKVISEDGRMSASKIILNRATGEIKSKRATLVITPSQKKKIEDKSKKTDQKPQKKE